MKLNPDGSLARLKAHLVAKEYSQMHTFDYQENYHVTKLTYVCLLILFVATHY